jgi:hypothetical protein
MLRTTEITVVPLSAGSDQPNAAATSAATIQAVKEVQNLSRPETLPCYSHCFADAVLKRFRIIIIEERRHQARIKR